MTGSKCARPGQEGAAHVVDIFRAAGATNVTWVWCPNVAWSGSGWPTVQEVYPGDDYVDSTCLDGKTSPVGPLR